MILGAFVPWWSIVLPVVAQAPPPGLRACCQPACSAAIPDGEWVDLSGYNTEPTPQPTRAPLRPNVPRYDPWAVLGHPSIWGIARQMVRELGVANIRDYLAVIFALVALARFLRKPPVQSNGT